MERLGARDLPSVMLAERRLILMGVVAMGARFVRVKTASLAVSQWHSALGRIQTAMVNFTPKALQTLEIVSILGSSKAQR
jgi:hypothetical protein